MMSATNPASEELKTSIAKLKRENIYYIIGLFACFIYALAVNPFIPYGPLLVPALQIYLGDLPVIGTFPLILFFLVQSSRTTSRQRKLQDRLRALEVGGRTPPPEGAGTPRSVQWWANRQRTKLAGWIRIGLVVLAADLALAAGLVILAPTAYHGAAGSWVFSATTTPLIFALIFIGVAWSSRRQEPLRFGTSAFGVHFDVAPSQPSDAVRFVAWNDLVALEDLGSSETPVVVLKIKDGKSVSIFTEADGRTALLSGFESGRPIGGIPDSKPALPPLSRSAAASPTNPPAGNQTATGGSTRAAHPEGTWIPNSMRGMWLYAGLFLLGCGAVLLLASWRDALNPKTLQIVYLSSVPVMIGLIMAVGSFSYPSAVRVNGDAFEVRERTGVRAQPFDDIVRMSSVGLSLSCTLRSGRTVQFHSLGAKEERRIQDGFRGFREGSNFRIEDVPGGEGSLQWLTNHAAPGAAAGFFAPLLFFVGFSVLAAALFLWRPGPYRDLLFAIPLAALPTPFVLFTVGSYRRAPSAVGIGGQGMVIRYPHRIFPASALVGSRWNEIRAVTDRRGWPVSPNSDTQSSPSSRRYLVFETAHGLVLTLGPVTPEIESSVLDRCSESARSSRIIAGGIAG
jgi:hypothetical protein